MKDDTRPKSMTGEHQIYEAPAIRHLGNLADLTQGKNVGGADGTQFLGIDLGS
ncbi:MAG: hypothetical protein AVDCRST_MAG10-1285 [uncultured Acidimicrobiales bacterium]|uniref:Lasso RiPP family leader peptide-containing protein n=1 Tax=uncultured Acidimicrobiales bacterium TaxID=310071 RepID=A0A6J4HUS9_9ACTN|nr:MAG: hypothetical protein AVDCRST_MAG10-1285 [uncultured Acidimicrobiales bacterium]